jgi:hypothetical protein
VTPSEKPSRNGQEADPESERTTVLASAAEEDPPTVTPPVVTPPVVAAPTPVAAESNGHGEPAEDVELSHVAPPPWQRVNNDAAFARPTIPVDPDGPTIQAPAPDRPVVTGTAAARMFGEPATPPSGFAALPPRTTVHLDGPNATTGGMRPAAPPNVLRRPGRGPRRANLQVKRFDPWSVLKLSLVLGVALFFVWLVAVGALYAVLDGMGVWDKVNGISTDLLQGNEGSSQPLISAGRVFGIAAIVGAVNIVLFSALATVGAFVYNVSADLVGGLEVTLAERE